MLPRVRIKKLECKDEEGCLSGLVLWFQDGPLLPIETSEEGIESFSLSCSQPLDFTDLQPSEQPQAEFLTETNEEIYLLDLKNDESCEVAKVWATQEGEFTASFSCSGRDLCITYCVDNDSISLIRSFALGFVREIGDFVLLTTSFAFNFSRLLLTLPLRLLSSNDKPKAK